MKRRAALVVLVAPLFTGFDCGSGDAGAPAGAPVHWRAPQGNVDVTIDRDPFAVTIEDGAGKVLLESVPAQDALAQDDPLRAYAPLATTHNTDLSGPVVMWGWNHYRGQDDPWKRAQHVSAVDEDGARLVVHFATSDPDQRSGTLTIEPQGIGVHIVIAIDPPAGPSDAAKNRVSLGFRMHDDDHFFGFGERFVRSDHRGQMLYTWVEDGGFGQGESVPPGPADPSPSGEGETNIPIPWFLSPRGFGMLANGSFRWNYHLGDERPDAWRIESTTPVLDTTIFVDPDPLRLVEALTEVTGRPPEIADWVLAPRRRGNPGSDEAAKLRAAHIPTSVIDTAVHYFPAGIGSLAGAPVKAVTKDLHDRGFKAIAYFTSFVSDQWHPVFDDAARKGYLVTRDDGSPFTVLDPPYNAGMVDFTNPDAKAWYQGFLQGALDDGWDGWMYDFGEYVPEGAHFANGMTGTEAHNLYPTLFQRAAFELLEAQRKKDYLVFVRSGYAGTGGLVPMVWAGDQNTDFSLSDGLPAALSGALNAGMSGIPLWGSDISGYHYIYNPPPDKELYLRWAALGAFSADMHDENEGSGHGPSTDRWQIWKDQESQDVYRKLAVTKTRMIPYVKVAVRQARERGTPVMRHLYLTSPADPRVYGIGDEYGYGDSLLVAPVVARGVTSRPVYLPAGSYYDFNSGERLTGPLDLVAPAPLDTVPLYAKMGAIIPLLSPDVETVVPAADGSVVSAQDRADFLEVLVFAGGSSELALDDGTVLSQSAPRETFDIGQVALGGASVRAAADEGELATCDACAWSVPSSRSYKVAVRLQDAATDVAVDAGPLHIEAKHARLPLVANVKRYLFTIRY